MQIRSLFASGIGNIVEWYDFALFIYLGPIFAHVFFPSHNPTLATLSIFATFAVGFICRPIGGIIFGHLGDRIGRAKTLRLSILLISVPTLLICLLPTYAQIGIWAPISLILLRLIQGMCIGGEYSGIIIYLAEMAPIKHRAFITSFAATGANMGLLIGMGITAICTHWLTATQLDQFGWRIAFLIGGLFGLVILYIRNFILETVQFSQLKNQQLIVKLPLRVAIQDNYLLIFKIIGLVSFGSVLYYATFIYLISYLPQFSHLSFQQVTLVQTILVSSMLLLVPLFGLLCDKIGRLSMYKLLCGIAFLTSWFIFYFFHNQDFVLIFIGLATLTIISSMEQATTLITVVEILPLRVRYTTLALAYNIGNMLFGGLTPLILITLVKITGNLNSPAYYLMATALLTFLVARFALKNHQHLKTELFNAPQIFILGDASTARVSEPRAQ